MSELSVGACSLAEIPNRAGKGFCRLTPSRRRQKVPFEAIYAESPKKKKRAQKREDAASVAEFFVIREKELRI